MTSAVTRQAIRRELYNQIPGLGFAGTADSITTTTIVDAFIFRDTTLGTNHYRGMYIYRPDLTTDDRIKKATTFNSTTGALSHGGSNYADTSDLDYEIVGLLHPDELNSCIQRAMTRIYFEAQSPLPGRITDGDMDSASVNWTNSGLATLEKVTTASRVFSGIRSLHTLANSVDDLAYSNTLRVFENRPFYTSAVVHVDVGTVELIAYNVTGAAEIGTASSSGEEGWVHLWMYNNFPDGCEEVRLHLNSTTSSTDAYWNHAVLYSLDDYQMPAPTWLDEPWKFLKLREASYRTALNSQTNGGYDNAYSRQFKDWVQPSMFSLDPFHLDTNPYAIQLQHPVPQNELWVEGKRPYSDLEALSTDASTTLAPLNLVYAYSKYELASLLHKRYQGDRRWLTMLAESEAEKIAETQSRPETPMTPIRREVHDRI